MGKRILMPAHRAGTLGLALAIAIACLAGLTGAASAQDNLRPQLAQGAVLGAPLAGRSIDLPAAVMLSAEDAERYRRIFDLQDDAMWALADGEIGALSDRRLMGHVLYQRYFHPDGWTASWSELRDWMDAYRDHPQAERVYDLALQRRPAGTNGPIAPVLVEPIVGNLQGYGFSTCAIDRPSGAARTAQTRISRLISDGAPSQALTYLEGQRGGLSAAEYDRLLGRIAASYYFETVYDRALEEAERAADRSGLQVPQAHWTAGLVHWRQGDFDRAMGHFAAVADNACASPWWASAGAFWAARSALGARQPAAISDYLTQAARYPHTSYGVIASRALGIDPALNFDPPRLSDAHYQRLSGHDGARRAMALLQIGQTALAEAELLRLRADADPLLGEAMIALAQDFGMPVLGVTLGNALPAGPGRFYDAALYPTGPWRPDGGWRVDQALIYAIMRTESLFQADAVSYAGATGLMQIMPSTARAMLDYTPAREVLSDPAFNLELGQRYIEELLAFGPVGDNLLYMLVGYNAGAGRLMDYVDQIDFANDPLLFLESVPNSQARAYMDHVLANFWIYRLRFGQDTPSLDAIVAGEWPRYIPQDEPVTSIAQRE